MPESVFRRLDVRKPGWKAKVKATMGESFKMVDAPQLPPWFMKYAEVLMGKFDQMSGTANLQRLMDLGQLPSGDTIEKYHNALTPKLKMQGRAMEAHLREIAEMIKCNIFQYYSLSKRVMILGEVGKTLSDFDYDPETLVPSMKAGDEGYVPELDAELSRDERAKFFHKLFTFYVDPHSILAMHAQEDKMLYLQLSRQGYIDYWTLLEKLEIPNVGTPPPIPLPQRNWTPTKDPQTGVIMPPVMEIRLPVTITEKLQAQSQLGLGMAASPAGRPASGGAPPQIESKDGGTRQTVTESK